jgi:hypothetical protein
MLNTWIIKINKANIIHSLSHIGAHPTYSATSLFDSHNLYSNRQKEENA